MKRTNWLILAIVIIAVLAFKWATAMRTIQYHGQTIKLSKPYFDYDSYKNDPKNLPPSEQARVQKLMTEAKIERTFSSRKDMVEAVGDIVFPGYGSGSLGETKQPDGSSLTGMSIEIPGADKDRYFIYECRNGTYRLIDDFAERSVMIFKFRKQGSQLVYTDDAGKEVFRRPMK